MQRQHALPCLKENAETAQEFVPPSAQEGRRTSEANSNGQL